MRGKRIVITGASSGIGLEMLEILKKENKIFAVARNTDSIKCNENVMSFSCDVSVAVNVDLLFEEAIKYLGEIDVFFANAGFAYYEKIENPDWIHISKIFETNVFSVIYSLQKLKSIKKEKEFKFVVTASAMSYLAVPGYALYAATKFALKGFADSFRQELLPGQLLSLVYPVATYTSFFKVAHADNIPWPRQTADKVARIIVKSVENNKKDIYPSLYFRLGLAFNRLIPIFKIYRIIEGKRFRFKMQIS